MASWYMHVSSCLFSGLFIFSGPVHTALEEFENGGLPLKTHQTFSAHTTPGEFKNRTKLLAILDWCFKKHSGSEITRLS